MRCRRWQQRVARLCAAARPDRLGPRHARLHVAVQERTYHQVVPKTVQIRDLDDHVYAGLVRRAAETGISVPELLRAEATRLAARPSMQTWLTRTRRRSSPLGRADVLAALDEQRGPWPNARR